MSKSGEKISISKFIFKYSLIIEIIVVFAFFQLVTKGVFMTTRNLSNLMMQGVTCSLIAVTMMMVIVSCNSDLSAGSVLGCFGVIAATLQVTKGWGTLPTILAVFACSILLGLWHGFWIAYQKLPAFIVTLATQLVMKGLILLIGNGAAIGPVSDSFGMVGSQYLPSVFTDGSSLNGLSLIITLAVIVAFIISSIRNENKRVAQGLKEAEPGKMILRLVVYSAIIFIIGAIFIFYKGFPYAIVLLAVITGVFSFVIKHTQFGRYVFALGGNAEAAKLSGINNEKIVLWIYILHSMVVALASIVYLGRVGQATATAGTSFEFTAITGCVVGGTSIMGGRGTVLGAVLGTMLMAGLDNGMSLLNLGQASQYLVKGLVLMLAIAMDVISRNKNG